MKHKIKFNWKNPTTNKDNSITCVHTKFCITPNKSSGFGGLHHIAVNVKDDQPIPLTETGYKSHFYYDDTEGFLSDEQVINWFVQENNKFIQQPNHQPANNNFDWFDDAIEKFEGNRIKMIKQQKVNDKVFDESPEQKIKTTKSTQTELF